MKRLLSFLLFVFSPLLMQAQLTRIMDLEEGNLLMFKLKEQNTADFRTVSVNNPLKIYRKEGKMIMNGDTINPLSIETMRLKPMTRFALLEDNTDFVSEAVENGLLALRRTFSLNHWNYIVLPVSLTAGQVLDAFGAETQLARFAGVSDEAVVDLRKVPLDVKDNMVVMEKGTFYLLRPSREPDVPLGKRTGLEYGASRIAGPVYAIPNVSMEAGVKQPLFKSVLSAGSKVRIRMYGTYTMREGSKDDFVKSLNLYRLTDDGLFVQQTDSMTVKAFNGWLTEAVNTDNHPVRFVIDGVGEDLTATDIQSVAFPSATSRLQGESRLYDVMGRPVAEGQLKRGIYVRNGRKIIVR